MKKLATGFARERLAQPATPAVQGSDLRRFACAPEQIAIYQYDPNYFTGDDSFHEGFARVFMRWDALKGFVEPRWNSYASTPVYLGEAAEALSPTPAHQPRGTLRFRH